MDGIEQSGLIENNNNIECLSTIVNRNEKCLNCKQKNVPTFNSTYKLTFHIFWSSSIWRYGTFKNIATYSDNRICNYLLCDDCNEYLVKKYDNTNNTRSSFLWYILPGSEKSVFNRKRHFYSMYSSNILLTLISNTMHPW